MYWYHKDGQGGLIIQAQTKYNDMIEMTTIPAEAFMADYGYGSWVHCTISYKFDPATFGKNLELHLNGKPRIESVKSAYTHTSGVSGKSVHLFLESYIAITAITWQT